MLIKHFIPVASATAELQWSEQETKKWFLAAMDKIESPDWKAGFKAYGTVQGTYFMTPDAKLVDFIWYEDPQSFIQQMETLREKASKLKNARETLSAKQIKEAEPFKIDTSTSIVQMFYRCVPTPKGSHPINQSISRDTLWIFKNEVEDLVKVASKKDEWVPFSQVLADRLVRLQLVDHVRGMADCFEPKQVQTSKFSMRFIGSREGGKLKAYEFKGESRAEKEYPGDINYKGKLGVEGKIEGFFEIDTRQSKIVKWRAYFDGQAWGANSNTWAQPRQPKFPLVIAMVEAKGELVTHMAPVYFPFYFYKFE